MTESLYNKLYNVKEIARQRFVDNFSGDSLNERWTQSGTGTFAMVNAIDEGFSLIEPTGSQRVDINFNQRRQYDFAGTTFIAITRKVTASTDTHIGLMELNDVSASADFLLWEVANQLTFYRMRNAGGGAITNTDSDISTDTTFRVLKISDDGTTINGSIDNIVKSTSTTNLPNGKMQPLYEVFATTTGTREGRIRYYEAYNT